LAKPVHMDKLYWAVESTAQSMQKSPTRASSQTASLAPPRAPTASQFSVPVPTVAANAAAVSEDAHTHLRRTTGGNERLIHSLAKTFLADAPKTLALIRNAIAKKDHTKLTSAAHLLKGSIAIFGAPKAVAAARNLEALGRERNLSGAETALHTLESEFTILQQELHVIQSAPEPDIRRKVHPRPRGDARFRR
ncbi:MAG: Hpt domain-containing protein, partial [Candidatus Acidiferrales bacterium]